MHSRGILWGVEPPVYCQMTVSNQKKFPKVRLDGRKALQEVIRVQQVQTVRQDIFPLKVKKLLKHDRKNQHLRPKSTLTQQSLEPDFLRKYKKN